jgi:YD repeat-containing protein
MRRFARVVVRPFFVRLIGCCPYFFYMPPVLRHPAQVIDPQGNAVTLNYDGQRRLVSLTDAGRRRSATAAPARRY